MENKLYSKLLSIQEHIEGFYKNKSTNQYKYVDGNSVLNEIRPLMNANKLLLKQEILNLVNVRHDYTVGHFTPKEKIKSEILSTAFMKFTWIDCETGEKDENLFAANGMNDWDKGVGSALTYGERYFLLKYFHIPTDADDPDELQRKKDEEERKKTPPPPQIIWLNQATYDNAMKSEKIDAIKATIEKYTKDGFSIKSEWKKNLENRIKDSSV